MMTFGVQVLVPLAVGVISNVIVLRFCERRGRSCWLVLLGFATLLAALLTWNYVSGPELIVVPDLHHKWKDEAATLCEKVGLRMSVKPGRYSSVRAGEVQEQSLEPGSLVLPKSKISVTICRGQPVGDELFGVEIPRR